MTQPATDLTPDEANRIMAEADCLATAAEVTAAIGRMAREITHRLRDRNPVVYGVMNGGLVLAGRLLCQLPFPLMAGYLHATRYGHGLTGAQLHWQAPPSLSPRGRTVLVLDDILDEGHTLAAILQRLKDDGAEEVFCAVLVHKHHGRKARPDMRADFTGLELEDRYLFGSGMDCKGYWRNADGIFALKDH